jgi:hypothetical protein
MSEPPKVPEPDWVFANIRLGAIAMVATNIAYLVAAQFLPRGCCEAPRIAMAMAMAMGLPAALFCMLVSHHHIYSLAYYSAKARRIALWAARISQFGAIAFLTISTTDLISVINRKAANYFSIALIVSVALILLHMVLLQRSKLRSVPQTPDAGAK